MMNRLKSIQTIRQKLKSGGFRRESILADTVEAILGAVYLDGGIEQVKSLILRLYDERLASIDIDEAIKDPKTRLQELLQSRKQPLPLYSVNEVKTSAQDSPLFEASCQVGLLGKVVMAKGNSHRKAEQKAAERALTLLEEIFGSEHPKAADILESATSKLMNKVGKATGELTEDAFIRHVKGEKNVATAYIKAFEFNVQVRHLTIILVR